MPWVKRALCKGCGVCIGECPVGAIEMGEDGYAAINDAECIRCGRCHLACPQQAIRHDSERIPQEVSANLRWVSKMLDHFRQPAEQAAFMQRMMRHFEKQKEVAQRTLATIEAAGDDPVRGLKAAIDSLSGRQDTESSAVLKQG